MSVSMNDYSLSVVETEQSRRTWKVFFGVLFASLRHMSTPYISSSEGESSYLGRFVDLLPN